MEGGDGKEGAESECLKDKGHVVSGEQGSGLRFWRASVGCS